MLGAYGIVHIAGFRENDVIYNHPPYFHVAAFWNLIVTLTSGCPTVTKRKFSASAFWNDIRKYNATVTL